MAQEGQLHLLPLKGFWADVGQPKDFLIGSALHLKSLVARSPNTLTREINECDINEGVMIDTSAKIGTKCRIGPHVVIGAQCVIGDGVRLSNCVIMPNAVVKDVNSNDL